LASAGVLQGEFQVFEELVNKDTRCSLENPLLGAMDQPGVGRGMAPWVPLQF
jgi:2-methylfumaryl-CoA isomerase